MKTAYVVISILNGYKNIHAVFASKADAETMAENMRDSWTYAEHEVYVCEYPVY